MGLFFYTQKGSIISMVDLPTTEIIEPQNLILSAFSFLCIPLSLVLDILYKKISVLIFFAVAVLQ